MAMHAHLYLPANRQPPEALLNGRPACDLPFMNRPLWHQYLRLLAELHVSHVALHVPAEALPDLDEAVTFGLQARHAGPALTQDALLEQRLQADRSLPELILSFDCLPSLSALQTLLAVSDHHHLRGIRLHDRQPVALLLAPGTQSTRWLAVTTGPSAELDGVMGYYHAHMQALEQLASWQFYERTLAPGVLAGHHLKLHESAMLDGPLLLGDFVRVREGCVLSQSIIGHDCLIGENCDIQQSIVLPGSRLGGHMHLHRKIVDGNRVIDPFRDCVLVVEDPLLLSQTDHHSWRLMPC